MSGLTLSNLRKEYGSFVAVDNVELSIPQGSFVCLLGPSGCGKTTLLRMIAGLERQTGGRILMDGEDITGIPTHKRELGMVFQSLALFPHLTVAENIAYALRIRGASKAEQTARAEELLDLIHLPGYGERAVSQLSGGQRQRVAIARALALSPKLFLLDEPLSALDAKLREEMQVELRQLQQKLGITTIVVTHDQREAMTMADLVVVMGEGRIRQAAKPVEIYRQPVDTFVADFIGATNLLPVRKGADNIAVFGNQQISGIDISSAGENLTLSVRPEELQIVKSGQSDLKGTVSFVRDLGATIETFVEVEGEILTSVTSPRERVSVSVGDEVGLHLPPEHCVVLTQ
ncbi:ABC transporter ATP-binding protein [Sneathiella sp.]|jgi:putative spermidine/putrescine transport system ATP-binding protein|uniref:ABC transporter ATP-binding protein n=1 Tax=Sneathiella sp. TaxID=1964365 RepID=UPI0039E4069E